jgi:hypothetical protein
MWLQPSPTGILNFRNCPSIESVLCRRILIMRRCDLNDTDASNNASKLYLKLSVSLSIRRSFRTLLVGFVSTDTDCIGKHAIRSETVLTETKLILVRSIQKVHYRQRGRTRERLWREGTEGEGAGQQFSVPSTSDSIDLLCRALVPPNSFSML